MQSLPVVRSMSRRREFSSSPIKIFEIFLQHGQAGAVPILDGGSLVKPAAMFGSALVLSILASGAATQTAPTPGSLRRDDPQLPRVMADIAIRMLQADTGLTPAQRLPLELAADRYGAARATLTELRRGRRVADPDVLLDLRWEIYARAREAQNKGNGDFSTAFRQAAADVLRDVDGLASYKLLYALRT